MTSSDVLYVWIGKNCKNEKHWQMSKEEGKDFHFISDCQRYDNKIKRMAWFNKHLTGLSLLASLLVWGLIIYLLVPYLF